MEIMNLIFVFVVSYAVAEQKLACCPPHTNFLSASEERDNKCWDPINNATIPITLDCNTTELSITAFLFEDDKVKLFVDELDNFFTVNSSFVCLGNESVSNATEPLVSQVAVICSQDPSLRRPYFFIEDVVLGYCMLVSSFFLILIVVIYSSFDSLRDNFGKCIINYCGSMAVGLFLMSIMKFVIYRGKTLCALRGFSTHFFLLAAFFWSNSVSIYALTETWQIKLPHMKMCKFRWYMLYSWGMPSILTAIMAIVNYAPGDHAKPGIGMKSCWFVDLDQQWIYMYSVMSLILVINMVIFSLTLRVFCAEKSQGRFKHTLQDVRFKVGISVKLFFVLGLPWIFEMIGSFMEINDAWALISIFNSSQGVILFIILVVYRKKAVRLMAERGWLCCCPKKLVEWYIGPLRNTKEDLYDNGNFTRALDLDNVDSDLKTDKDDIQYIDKA